LNLQNDDSLSKVRFSAESAIINPYVSKAHNGCIYNSMFGCIWLVFWNNTFVFPFL